MLRKSSERIQSSNEFVSLSHEILCHTMAGDEVIWWPECEQAAPPLAKKAPLGSLVRTAFRRILLANLPYVECLQYNAVKNAELDHVIADEENQCGVNVSAFISSKTD